MQALQKSVKQEKLLSEQRNESDWTLLDRSKKYREYLAQGQSFEENHSAINVCKMIALGTKRGNLVTSDKINERYP